MFATFVRNSSIADSVIYFGPMGCQTGFYLLTRGQTPETVYEVVLDTLQRIIDHDGEMFGASRKECGNYLNLDLECAKKECSSYYSALKARGANFTYPEA